MTFAITDPKENRDSSQNSYQIKLKNIPGFSFEANSDETLLQAAEKQGITLPVGCENGLCGTCKGRLISGKISYGSQEIYGLTPEEMEENQILFCCAIPEEDCLVEHHGIEIPPQHYDQTLKISGRKKLSPYLTELTLETPQPWIYKAGQYLNIKSPLSLLKNLENLENLENQKTNLPFSIANAPGTSQLKLHIQILENQPNKTLLEEIIAAQALPVEGPHGQAYLRNGSRPILMLAGGSGFAPMKGMLEQLIQTNSPRQIFLYWGAKTPEFLYEHQRLEELSKTHLHFHYIPVISETSKISAKSWSGRTGLVHEAVLADYQTLLSFECYIAGPYAMIQIAKEAFVKKGLSPRLIYSDM
jgi:CDP-4-dehydro-6-deoxyglucose reductase